MISIRHKRGVALLLIAVAAALTAGFFFGVRETDQDKVITAIKEYNDLLPQAYADSTDVLRTVATDREQGRLDIFITQLLDQQKRLQVSLSNIEFGGVKLQAPKTKDDGGGKNMGSDYKHRKSVQNIDVDKLPQAVVSAREIWKFRYLEPDTQRPLDKWREIRYQTTYTLVKVEGDWFINDLKFTEQVLD